MISPNTDLKTVCNHFNVSRETFEKLSIYLNLLVKWNGAINLVSKSTIQAAAVRHFADSLQVWQYRKLFSNWVDIGSGAGFPGLVLAILACDEGDQNFAFVESDARKCAFLRNVSRETGVPITVLSSRIEDVSDISADVLSARALATVEQLFIFSEKLLKPDGICLYLKGRNCEKELAEASRNWTFDAERFDSETDENGKILRIGNITRGT